MPTSTREKLVLAAQERFYRDGFRNVGLDAILADVGISKTAFYKHFESKEKLMLAVLEGQHIAVQQLMRQMVREVGGPSPLGQLRAILDVAETFIESDDFHGCIFVNAVMEFPLPNEPAHVAASQNKRAIEDFVVELAENAGANDARALAQAICLIIEGTYITRQVTGNKRSADIARPIADLVIARHCGETQSAA